MVYLESRGNSEQETCAFYVKIWIRKCDLIWPDLDLISVKSQVGWRHRVKWMSRSVSACKMAQKTCVARHVCGFYFLARCFKSPDICENHAYKYINIHDPSPFFIDCWTPASRLRRSASVWNRGGGTKNIFWDLHGVRAGFLFHMSQWVGKHFLNFDSTYFW